MASSNPHHHHHHHDLPAASTSASSSVPVSAAASTAAPAAAAETGGGRGGLPPQPLSPPAYGYTSTSSATTAPQRPRQVQGSTLPSSDIIAVTGLPTTSSMSGSASGPASGSISGSGPRSISGSAAGNHGNPPPPAFRGSSYASVVSGGAESGGIAPQQNLQRPSRYASQFSTTSTSYPLSTAAAAAAAAAAATTSRATTTGVPAYLMYPPTSSHTRHMSRGNTGDADGLGFGNSGVADGRDGTGRGDGGSGGSSMTYAWNRWSGQVPSHASQYAGLMNGGEGYSTAAGSAGPTVASASASVALASPAAPRFFVPSYLRGSRHVERLEEARRARLLAQQRESRASAGINTHQSHHNGGSLSTSSSNVSLQKLGTPSLPASSITATGLHSHRGLAHEIVERIPGGSGGNNVTGPTTANTSQQQSRQIEEVLAPLPSRWSETDRFSGLDVLAEGWQVRFASNKTGTHDEAAAVRADHPMPRQCGIYYYEVTVMSKGKEGLIGIGFSGPKVPLNRLPGWEPESWAYHGDDGYSFCCTASGKPYGPKFASLDVIGCGVNFRTGCAFFTKNGVHLGTAFKDIESDWLYPSVGMKKPGEHLRVNFGQMPFVYDIDGMVEREKQYLQTDVNKANVASLNPPLDETRLVQELVAQYLAHEGYVETARAFTGEMNENSMALAKGTGTSVKDLGSVEDVDAMNRQKIRASILDGDIDKALQLTTTYYPSVLRENENIYFKLRCHKFIEMIRSCIELHSEITGTSSSSSNSNRRRRRREAVGKLSHVNAMKARSVSKKGFNNVQSEYGVKPENGLGETVAAKGGAAKGEGNRGADVDGFAQDMELDNENGGVEDCYGNGGNGGTEAVSNADAGNGDSNGANWDRMDMEDGESGDDGAGHGVSIISAINGGSQKNKGKKEGESNGLAGSNAKNDNLEDEDEDEDISDSSMSSNSDSDSENEDYDDDMDDDENEQDDTQNRKANETMLQEKYNTMMQLTIQYGQELKSEFDGDPRREVKQALEETFALIAYPDARESMLAPLLDVSERVPVAEELNGAILVSLGKSSAAALESLYQQTVVLVNDLAEDGGPGALIHVGNDFMACS